MNTVAIEYGRATCDHAYSAFLHEVVLSMVAVGERFEVGRDSGHGGSATVVLAIDPRCAPMLRTAGLERLL